MSGLIAAASDRVRRTSDEALADQPLTVLDMFAGGATIPFEAARAGHRVVAVENNQLAQFINSALLNLSQTKCDLPGLVGQHGQVVLDNLRTQTASLFPMREATSGPAAGYFWSRSMNCDCGATLSLQKRPWLAKRGTRSIRLNRVLDRANSTFSIEIDPSGAGGAEGSCWSGSSVVCPFCSKTYSRASLGEAIRKRGFDEPTAYYTTQPRKGKTYFVANDQAPSTEEIALSIKQDADALGVELPTEELPRWSGITNSTLYGLSRFTDLFNHRQLAAIVKCCRLLREQYDVIAAEHSDEVARSVIAILSGLIDQLADWNCRICMWIPQNEQVGRGLSGPGIPMMWDFIETDPVGNGPANLHSKLDRIVEATKSIPKFTHIPQVIAGDARHLPFADNYFDLVVTDPPYFDNIFYHILADCIYVWKKFALQSIFPEFFSDATTDQGRELSASKDREGSKVAAAQYYTNGLSEVLREARRVLRPEGMLTFVFAHSTIDGWAAVLKAFESSGFEISAAWPLRVERNLRPRSMTSKAVNISFALEATPGRVTSAPRLPTHDALKTYKLELEALSYSGDDLGQALFGLGVAGISTSHNSSSGSDGTFEERLLDLSSEVAGLVDSFAMERR